MPTNQHNVLGGYAESYAARGWWMFPLKPRGKVPLTGHGLHDATIAGATIREWWTRWPDANIGVRTGSESGLVVIDLDGPEGIESMRRLVAERTPLPSARVRTARGVHLWFAHPGAQIRNSAGQIAPHIDVRGDGGYVLAPPSIHPDGRPYTWLTEPSAELPLPPRWLLDLLAPPPDPPPDRARARAFHRGTGDGLSPYVIAAVQGEARAVADAPEGQRNERLNVAAFKLGGLVGAGVVSEVTVTEILTIAARTAGLPEREATATIGSGLRAGMANPREVV